MKIVSKQIFIWLIILNKCFGQVQFKYFTNTDSVIKDGVYKINLDPSIVAKCKRRLDDLRLLDAEGKQVPYLINYEETAFKQPKFIEFKILIDYSHQDSASKIVVINQFGTDVENLVLILKNSIAERSVNISGSNNLKQWFIIKEFINLEKANGNDETHFVQSIALPKVDYKYYEIKFNGRQYNPMFVEHVGTYNTKSTLKEYFAIPSPKIIQKESTDKTSYVKLIFNEPFQIDKLQLFGSGPRVFERNIKFKNGYYDAEKNDRIGVFSSKSDNIFFLSTLSGELNKDTYEFTIANNDNQPIHIDSVKAYQNSEAIFTFLKAGKIYTLAFGNDSLNAPIYDIAAFKDSFSFATPLLTVGTIKKQNIANNGEEKKPKESKILLWGIIGLVLLLLLYFTSVMLKQIDKK